MKRSLPTVILLLMLVAPSQSMADLWVIANPQSPIDSLSETDLRKLYLGKLQLFPGQRTAAELYDLPSEYPAFVDFYQHLAGMTPQQIARYRAGFLFSGKGRVPRTAGSHHELLRLIGERTTALGYLQGDTPPEGVKVVLHLPDPR